MRSPSQLTVCAIALLVLACGGGDGPGSRRDGGGEVDSSPPSECDGLGETACTGTAGCQPVCTGGICDCDCPQVAGGWQCGCAECERQCFSSYDSCATTARLQPCGDNLCDRATHVCVVRSAFQVVEICVEVPERCQRDRNCACLGADVCDTPTETCADDERFENQVTCACPACV